MCENKYCLVNQAIVENLRKGMTDYEQWRAERFNQLRELAYIADIELDRRKARKRRKIEGW